MDRPPGERRSWGAALRHGPLWRRALLLGLAVGGVQVAVNQGDHWLDGSVDPAVVTKSVLSPLITVAVAFVSAASAYVQGR